MLEYNILGFSLDDLVYKYGLLPEPAILKIDVDGIEHLILRGATKVLSSQNCKSVFIEVSRKFSEQSKVISDVLISEGFELDKKLFRGKNLEEMSSIPETHNQIWLKKRK